jgi:hypothetical protein
MSTLRMRYLTKLMNINIAETCQNQSCGIYVVDGSVADGI